MVYLERWFDQIRTINRRFTFISSCMTTTMMRMIGDLHAAETHAWINRGSEMREANCDQRVARCIRSELNEMHASERIRSFIVWRLNTKMGFYILRRGLRLTTWGCWTCGRWLVPIFQQINNIMNEMKEKAKHIGSWRIQFNAIPIAATRSPAAFEFQSDEDNSRSQLFRKNQPCARGSALHSGWKFS